MKRITGERRGSDDRTYRSPGPSPDGRGARIGARRHTRLGHLSDDGIEVIDVPAKLTTRVRMLSTGHGRKNDDADAVSVGIAALNAPKLTTARVDGAITAA